MKILSQLAFTLTMVMSLALLTGVNITSAQSGDTDTTNNSCVELSNNMRYRTRDISVNNEVSDLQDYLIAEGYMSGNTTGYFGVATLKAVKSFQSQNGLLSSGYVGPVTRAKIKALSCDTAYSNPITPITPNPIACTMEMRYCPNGEPMKRDVNCGWHAEMCKSNTSSQVDFGAPTVLGYKDGDVIQGQAARITYYVNSNGANNNKGYIDFVNVDNGGTYSIYDLPMNIGGNQYNWYDTNKSQSVQGTFSVNISVGRYTPTLNYGGKQVKGQIFSVVSNTVVAPTNALKAVSATLYNTNTSYAPGQTIKFSIQGFDSNGQIATPAKGFNVQWHMYDYRDNTFINNTTMINGAYQGDNAVFNYTTNMWDITATAPSANLASGAMRKLEASFYCSNTSLGCYSSYENQIEKSFMFSITGTAQTSIKAYNVLGNEMTKSSIYTDETLGLSGNNFMLGRVDVIKGGYKEIKPMLTCSTMTDRNSNLPTNSFQVSGKFKFDGITIQQDYLTFNCPELPAYAVYMKNFPSITKDFETITYEITGSGSWNSSGTPKKEPVGILDFTGIRADGSFDIIKSIAFIYSIKG